MAIEFETRTDTASGHLDEPFWRGLDDHRLLIPRCSRCETWVWPARPLCPSCHTGEPRWTELRPRGTLFTWTRTWYPFVAERSESLPYTVGLVELEDAPGVRVLGLVDDVGIDPAIGGAMVGHFAAPEHETLGLSTLRWAQEGKR